MSNKTDFQSALSTLRQGDPETAVVMFRNVLVETPDHAAATHFLGIALHNLGHTDEARRLVDRSIALAPEQPEFRRNLGGILKDLGAYEEALPHLQAAAAIRADDASLLASICEMLFRLNRLEEARAAGQKALELKDAHAIAAFDGTRLAGTAPPFQATQRTRNVIAFSLWGDDDYYRLGALENARLARHFYPEWMCRIYCDQTVPQDFIRQFVAAGAQVVQYPVLAKGNEALFWRFQVANDPSVDRFLCRDCDSPFTVRERVAVEEWIRLGTCFHVMRDHVIHVDLMLAGLWGGVAGLLPDMKALAQAQLKDYRGRWADQTMLGREIWPRIRDTVTVHDSQYSVAQTRPFPEFGTLPPPLHAGYSKPRVKRSRNEFQI